MDHIPVDQQRDPHLFSHAKTCRRAKAVWKSFASSDKDIRLKINRGSVQDACPSEVESSSDVSSLIPEMLKAIHESSKAIQVLSMKTETKTTKTPKTVREPRPKLEKANAKCLNPICGVNFDGYPYQQVCNECFQTAKSDRQPIKLRGSRGSGNYDGPSFSIIDSSKHQHQKRGGWKIDARKMNSFRIDFGCTPLKFSYLGALSASGPLQLGTTTVPVLRQRVHADVDFGQKIFFGTDSCGGVGATGIGAFFHEQATPVDWVIEGMKAGAEALVTVEGSGVAVMMVQDRDTNEDLILLHGGMLKCPSSEVTSTVGSSSQVGNHYNATKGYQGALFHTADPSNAYIQLPQGRSVALHVNDDGAYGCYVSTISPSDPRLQSTVKIWMSNDCVYQPPGSSEITPIQINQETVRLRKSDVNEKPPAYLSACTLVDEDKSDSLMPAVADVLSGPAMGDYSYITPLTDSSKDLESLGGIFGGRSSAAILKTIDHGFGGKQILTPKGIAAVKAHNTAFQHPASNIMKQHKDLRTSKLDKSKLRPTVPMWQSIATDTLSLNIPGLNFRYFQLLVIQKARC